MVAAKAKSSENQLNFTEFQPFRRRRKLMTRRNCCTAFPVSRDAIEPNPIRLFRAGGIMMKAHHLPQLLRNLSFRSGTIPS